MEHWDGLCFCCRLSNGTTVVQYSIVSKNGKAHWSVYSILYFYQGAVFYERKDIESLRK